MPSSGSLFLSAMAAGVETARRRSVGRGLRRGRSGGVEAGGAGRAIHAPSRVAASEGSGLDEGGGGGGGGRGRWRARAAGRRATTGNDGRRDAAAPVVIQGPAGPPRVSRVSRRLHAGQTEQRARLEGERRRAGGQRGRAGSRGAQSDVERAKQELARVGGRVTGRWRVGPLAGRGWFSLVVVVGRPIWRGHSMCRIGPGERHSARGVRA